MSILRISASSKKYGGNLYEDFLDRTYSGDDYETFCPKNHFENRFISYLTFPLFYLRLLWVSIINPAVYVIQPLETVLWLNPKKKNIVIFHHFDPSFSNFLSRLNQRVSFFFLKANKSRIYRIVVVSQYWREFLIDRGFVNVEVIYNCFDLERFSEIERRVVHGQKFSIYIGNGHPKKGCGEVAKALGNLDVKLITTGYSNYSYPNVENYSLSYMDYLQLLKDVDLVITYSLFKEGWCRTAHEALLVGTPVVGSGAGGMKELLSGAGQVSVSSINELREYVAGVICGDILPKEINMNYVRSYSYSLFAEKWRKLIG